MPLPKQQNQNEPHPLLNARQIEMWRARGAQVYAEGGEELNDNKNIYLYGIISPFDFWGVEITSKQILTALKKVKGNFTLHINSPGGDVFEGSAMMASLQRFMRETGYQMTVSIEGLAASMASAIAAAFPNAKVEISGMGLYMIHRPMISVFSANIPALENMIQFLEKTENNMMAIYSRKSGMGVNKIAAKIESKDWEMSAAEAVDNGFADEVIGTEEEAPTASAKNLEGLKDFSTQNLNHLIAMQTEAMVLVKNRKGESNASAN